MQDFVRDGAEQKGSPEDFVREPQAELLNRAEYCVDARSVVVLVA
jgi:hypothetical protein